MNAELRNRLLSLNAQLFYERVETDAAVWLACDLLVAGVDTPALCELAGESPARLDARKARPLIRRVFAELDVPLMAEEQAEWVLGREVAHRILAGADRDDWEDHVWRVLQPLPDDARLALIRYDYDPEPFLSYVREYLERAEEQLTRW